MTVPCDPALEWLSVLKQRSGSQLQLQGSLAGLVEAEPKRMATLVALSPGERQEVLLSYTGHHYLPHPTSTMATPNMTERSCGPGKICRCMGGLQGPRRAPTLMGSLLFGWFCTKSGSHVSSSNSHNSVRQAAEHTPTVSQSCSVSPCSLYKQQIHAGLT